MVLVRILTFNVNGIRSIRDFYAKTKGWSFAEFLNSLAADILCFQETKANKVELIDHDIAFPPGYHAYFAFPRQPKKIGYSGVVTFVKDGVGFPAVAYKDAIVRGSPLDGFNLVELENLDSEGRIMMTDHEKFIVLNVYFPNDSGPERASFRNQFYSAIMGRVDEMVRKGQSIIIATDWNTTRHLSDHCDFVKPYLDELVPKFGSDGIDEMIEKFSRQLLFINGTRDLVLEPLGMQEVSDVINQTTPKDYAHLNVHPLIETFFREKPSRLWAYQYLNMRPRDYCLRDCFREIHPGEPNRFTCWNTLIGARGSNYGMRIDYILAMGALFTKEGILKDADQMYDIMGSDHCPVWALLDFPRNEAEATEIMPKPVLATNIRKQQRLDSFFIIRGKRKGEKPEEDDTRPKQVTLKQQTLSAKDDGPVPRCSVHGEPGREWIVKKAGPNRGRKFFLCSRPVGHSTDPNSRCNFFQWK